MSRKIKPMLSFLIKEPFDNPSWLFEIKWDGFRAIAEVKGKKVALYSRSFQSFNVQYSPIIEALVKLNVDAVFDGEIVVLNKKGASDFQALQNYQKTGKGNLRYCIFDLMYYKGKDMRDIPLIERKLLLKNLLAKKTSPILLYSKHIIGQGKKLFSLIKKKKLEGIMAKESHSSYTSTRSRSWLKIKTHARQEAVICGFTSPKGSRKNFGSLLLGVYEKGSLRFIGKVGGGFNIKSLTAVLDQLSPLITKKCPFAPIPKMSSNAIWVKPKLICEVSFAEWTKEGRMRQPIFIGIRKDKKPKQVVREKKNEIF